jgi:tetratricopeptide (TPR) repeat protein
MPYRVPKSRLLHPRTAREVSRVRLGEVLRQGFAKSPVLVLAAGAGWGKSTLMASVVAGGGVWITLAEDCQDPVVLGWHLLEAYRPRLGRRGLEVERALENGAWAQAAEALLEELAARHNPLGPTHLLVLDEAQRAASREALAFLRTLSQAPGLQMAVLSRRAAPWEVLGRVLGERELAFDAEEALELALAIAPELPAFEVEQAHSLVQGWPLGLRLLLRAMQRGARPEEAFYAHPDPAGLLAYLLPSLPEDLQQLAARASVLGELGPEESAWVGDVFALEPYAGDLLLEQVGGRIRFHPLVRQALIGLLEPAEVRSLLTRAADAALERGEGVRAAGYLLEAGRLGHAADLVMSQGAQWLRQGLTYTVLAMLERIPQEMFATRPLLRYLHAEGLRQAGRYAEAEQAYRRALESGVEQAKLGLARLFLDTVEPARAWPYLEAARKTYPEEAKRLWAENLLNSGRVTEAAAMGLSGPRLWLRSGQPDRALQELRREHTRTLPVAQNHREGTLLLALLEAIAGDAESAQAMAHKGRREGETLGSPFVVALAEARLGHALLAQDRWGEARRAYERALALAEGGPARLKVEALGGLAAVGEARAYAEMIRLSREAGDPWVEAFMTLAVAYAHLRRGEPFALPALTALEDPFLLALAAAYPWSAAPTELLERYPFLARPTLFAPPIHRVRRLLWERGKLSLPYHPGVRVEIVALGGLRVRVNGQEVRLKREKTRLLLALLLLRDWSKEALVEALEVSDGEFRVLWSELLGALEPGRPSRVQGYFLKPYGLAKVPELWVDLWNPPDAKLLPLEGFDHPEIDRFREEYRSSLRRRLLQSGEAAAWLEALRLEPTDEAVLERLLDGPLAAEAWSLYAAAMRELGLEVDRRLERLRGLG